MGEPTKVHGEICHELEKYRDIIECVGKLICAYQGNQPFSYLLQDFSPIELQYFPLCYLIKYAPSLELEKVWGNLPKIYQNNKDLILDRFISCCLRFFNLKNKSNDCITKA